MNRVVNRLRLVVALAALLIVAGMIPQSGAAQDPAAAPAADEPQAVVMTQSPPAEDPLPPAEEPAPQVEEAAPEVVPPAEAPGPADAGPPPAEAPAATGPGMPSADDPAPANEVQQSDEAEADGSAGPPAAVAPFREIANSEEPDSELVSVSVVAFN